MPWFMDPMPDGDSVHQVAQAYQTAHAAYTPHIQQTQTALDATTPVWSGPGSAAHSQVVALTQQRANEHAGWLVVMANVFYVLGTLLKIIFILQMAWLVIQGGTVLIGLLTMGLGVLEGEGAAAAVEAVITAVRQAISSLLQAMARALMASLTKLAIGGAAGGLTGLAVGINTVETNHLSGWNAVLAIGGDTFGGATAGAVIATNPWALAGTAVGVGQITTNAALGGQTSFEQGSAQWAQQALGGIPLVGGSLVSAFAAPTDVQGAFDTIIADTLAVGGVSEMFTAAEGDAAGLKPNDTTTASPTNESPVTESSPSTSAGTTDPNTAQVYRVQGGGSQERILVTPDGNIEIQGDNALFLNFNQQSRAFEFLARRGDGAYIVTFDVNDEFLQFVRDMSVSEREARLFPDLPFRVDTRFPDQFGLRSNLFDFLKEYMIPGSARVIPKS